MRLALRPAPAALGLPQTRDTRATHASAAWTAQLHQPQSPPCRPESQQQRHTPRRKPALRSGGRRSTTSVASALAPLGLTLVQQDVVAALAAMAGALACVKSCDALADSGAVDRKLTRKLVHIICGPGFVLTWLLFSSSPEARFIAALVPLANGVRLVAIGSRWVDNPAAVKAISRSGDSTELLRGPLFYVLVMVVATLAFWRTSPVGLVVIALMCFGDGFADVAGRKWGQAHKWAFNPDKSYAGSAAMFIAGLGCSAALLAAFSAAGHVSVTWQTAGPALVAITAAATLVEALPLSDAVDDNISVPSVAMVLAALML